MPELPEVETIKRELEKAVLGKKITDVIINNPKVIKQPSPPGFYKKVKEYNYKKHFKKRKTSDFRIIIRKIFDNTS